jgi:hypothetical protein
MSRLPSFGLLLLLAAVTPLAAQNRAPAWQSWRAPSLEQATSGHSGRAAGSAGTPGLVLAGLGGGTMGFFGGGLIGWGVGGGNSICRDDACGLEGAAYGAVIGESLLLPLAVHLADHRHGSYWLSLIASAGIGAVGILAINATNDASPLIAVPIAQIISSILIERATARD